jgi:hypothetical protein
MTELEKINEKFSYLEDYLKYRIDIISNNPNRWLRSSFKELPTFEYYLKNCILDKGGNYDFTKKNYGNEMDCHLFKIRNIKKTVCFKVRHSIWMGTAFNHEIIIN